MNSRGEETNGRKGKRLNQRLRKQRRVRFSKLSSQKQQSLQTQLMKATKLTRKNAQRDRDYLNFLNVSNKRKYRELLSRKEFAIADELCSDAREILRKYNIFLTSSFLEAKFLSERWKDVLKAESGALDDVFDAVSKIILEDEGYVMEDLELTKKIDEQFLKFMDQLEDHQRGFLLKYQPELHKLLRIHSKAHCGHLSKLLCEEYEYRKMERNKALAKLCNLMEKGLRIYITNLGNYESEADDNAIQKLESTLASIKVLTVENLELKEQEKNLDIRLEKLKKENYEIQKKRKMLAGNILNAIEKVYSTNKTLPLPYWLKSHLKKRSENVQEWNMPRIEKSKDTHKSVGKRDTNMHYGTDLKSQFDDIYTDTMKINISNDEDNYHIDRFAKLHESSKAHFLLNLLQKTEDATVELMNAMRQMIGSDDLTMNMSVAK